MRNTRQTVLERDAAPEGVDLKAIDAFLEKGVDALAEPTVDPLSVLKALPAQRVSAEPQAPAGGGSASPAPVKRSFPSGAIQVSVTDDRMQAHLTVRTAQVAGLGIQDVMDALKRAGVSSGIDEDAVIELIHAIPEAADPELSLMVAQGTPAQPGVCVEVTYPALTSGGKHLAHLIEAGRRVRELLAGGDVRGIAGGGGGFPLLLPGEIVARVRPAVEGMPGLDVMGKVVPVATVAGNAPRPGAGVKVSPDGQTYLAEGFGYLTVGEQEVGLLSPLFVSADGMRASVLDLCPPNRPLDAAALIGQMRAAGVVTLPQPDWLSTQLKDGTGKHRAILVAVGRTPQPGQNAKVEMRVEVGSRAGKVLEDGSIDFRERNFAVTVEKDALLAVKTHATQGTPGRTVLGQALSAEAGKDAVLAAGKGVEAVAGPEGGTLFYARQEGCVRLVNNTLEVGPGLQVPGDVDFGTGNIDFRGDLTVGGSVREGFSVKATGDVVIAGGIENGAQVVAGKSVTVSKGIFGEKTRVVAVEHIRAQFVQEAALACRGSVEVGSYIYNARVRSGASVTVLGRGERGGIVGGEVCAKTCLTSASVGSEHGTPTRVMAGLDADLMRNHQKIGQALDLCRANVQKIMASLKVGSADPREIGRAFAGLSAAQRDRARLLARKLGELTAMQTRLEEDEKTLTGQMAAVRKAAQILVVGTIYHNVDVFIGRAHTRTQDPLRAAALRLSPEEQIEIGPLKPAGAGVSG